MGSNLATWRAAGITVPFADATIASVAIANNVELWTRDRHFANMQAVVPALKLFQEPP
jgi:predicted nucleic acid-binding protein